MYVCVLVHTCAFTCVGACGGGAEVDVETFISIAPSPSFLRQGLSLNLELIILLEWLPRESLEPDSLCPPVQELQGCDAMPSFSHE